MRASGTHEPYAELNVSTLLRLDGGLMASDPEKVDEVADVIDDIKTTVEEIEDDPPAGVNPKTVRKLKDALEDASGIADDLEDEQERSDQ